MAFEICSGEPNHLVARILQTPPINPAIYLVVDYRDLGDTYLQRYLLSRTVNIAGRRLSKSPRAELRSM